MLAMCGRSARWSHFNSLSEFETKDDGDYTLADGFFPYLLAGVDIPINDQIAVLLEYKHDFQKKEDGADYGGDIFTAGLRIRW